MIGCGRKTAISGVWGGFGVLGLCGWAGAAGAGQCCEFGRFRFGGQINTGFSFKWRFLVMRKCGRKTAISGVWGGLGVLGRCGWVGGAGEGQC